MVVGNVVLWQRFWWLLMMRDVVEWRRWRVGFGLMLHLIERRLLPLFLLMEDVDAKRKSANPLTYSEHSSVTPMVTP
jgi:hypothetical protein